MTNETREIEAQGNELVELEDVPPAMLDENNA
jgi:hypothetical protein